MLNIIRLLKEFGIAPDSFFYFGFIGVMTAGGAYTLKAATIEALPIPKTIVAQQQPIITLVEQILTIKQENPQVDTTAQENEIDILVYKLYNLTYDEVKLIDPDFHLSEVEYSTFE